MSYFRLGVHLARTSRLAGTFLSRSLSSSLQTANASVSYRTQHTSKGGGPPQRWYALDPELEDLLVPRRLSITPLESWLSIRYSLPQMQVFEVHKQIDTDPSVSRSPLDCPPSDPATSLDESGLDVNKDGLQCKNILKIRRRKMNRHKYKKLQKRQKFLKRKIMDGRKKRKQANFERDLKRIWRQAGLKKLPDGFQFPKIYLTRKRGAK